MKLLVKLGGTLLDEPASRQRLAGELTAVAEEHQLVVVHGGGKQMTRYLAERGVESSFVHGLRVTTPDVVDAILKVFAGTVNHELVASLVAAGALPVGLTGIDAALTVAERVSVELGQVGKPTRTDPALLNLLTANGYVPVLACVAGNRQGEIFNVNADQMAISVATGFGATKLCFLTDVPGVKGADGQVIDVLTASAAHALIADGVATGGMEAKLVSACEALAGGVASVIIAPGATPGVLARLLRDEAVGTRMVAG
ncbi:MAG: acetylglutamate kinase [Bryobacteraceae bacterium]|nr:acetylglutamate kinase [Bryobacteraceae bacterium]